MKSRLRPWLDKNRGPLTRALRAVVTVGLLAALVANVDARKVGSLLTRVNWMILVPVFLYLPAILLSALKWQILLGWRLPFWALVRIYWIGNFFSNFLPSTIGGDGYRVIKVKGEVGTKTALGSVLLDRASGFLGTLILFVLLSLALPGHLLLNRMDMLVCLVGLFALALLAIYVASSRFSRKVLEFLDVFREFRTSWKSVLSISLIYPALGITSLWFYFLMYGYRPSILATALFYLAIQLITLIPISINAIGVYEVSVVGLFATIGIPAEVSLSISLLSRAVMLLQTSVGGALYLGTR
jgi:uncharacterized membrane protein YbhN (UPF0104 family)